MQNQGSRFFDQFPKLNPTLDVIIPGPNADEEVRRRAVYQPMIDKLSVYLEGPNQQARLDRLLKPYRQIALDGSLAQAHHTALLELFRSFKSDLMRDHTSESAAWKDVCRTKMFLAQILFLDNTIKQGIQDLAPFGTDGVVGQLSQYILQSAQTAGGAMEADAAHFYAALFFSQALMDLLFVRTDGVVHHRPGGVFKTSEADYLASTLYLEMANSKLVTARDAERALCYELTTGWSEGLDLEIWNALNAWYYGRDHIFSKFYDDLLEAMLPQFAWSKARAAQSIVDDCPKGPVHILEIGAGSGGWAADFYNALTAEQRARFTYTGIEPGQAMIASFHQLFEERTGAKPPQSWRIQGGAALENVTADPTAYLNQDACNLIVFSFSAHHCFGPSLSSFLKNKNVAAATDRIYILEGLEQHGSFKMFYMWTDVESPEDFRNVSKHGDWKPETLWQEPFIPLPNHAVTRGWCQLRQLTRPS